MDQDFLFPMSMSLVSFILEVMWPATIRVVGYHYLLVGLLHIQHNRGIPLVNNDSSLFQHLNVTQKTTVHHVQLHRISATLSRYRLIRTGWRRNITLRQGSMPLLFCSSPSQIRQDRIYAHVASPPGFERPAMPES